MNEHTEKLINRMMDEIHKLTLGQAADMNWIEFGFEWMNQMVELDVGGHGREFAVGCQRYLDGERSELI